MTCPIVSPAIMPADDPRRADLESRGWKVVAESFAARIDLTPGVVERLYALAVAPIGLTIRRLGEEDVPAILALDETTLTDYPGGPATRHAPLAEASACPSATRVMHGALDAEGRLVGLTVLDLGTSPAEVDFTVVAATHRGRGAAVALKATSLIHAAGLGVASVRTGGAAENTAIRAANARLGFVEDERWVALEPGGQTAG